MNALVRLKKASIRASDIASQYWCEKQMELNYLYGQKITKEIRKGRRIHGDLESETNVPIVLMPTSYADFMYKSMYTSYMALKTLSERKRTREVQVYGSMNGFKLVGKIDQLELKDNEVIVQEDKTRGNDNIPSEAQMLTHKVQVMLYRKMLDDMREERYTRRQFEDFYRTSTMQITPEFKRQLESLDVERELMGVGTITDAFFSSVRRMGRVSDMLYLRYINQFTGNVIKLHRLKYSDEEMSQMLDFVMKYWNGEREALPVPEEERWKCNFCAFFGNRCKVWWGQSKLGV